MCMKERIGRSSALPKVPVPGLSKSSGVGLTHSFRKSEGPLFNIRAYPSKITKMRLWWYESSIPTATSCLRQGWSAGRPLTGPLRTFLPDYELFNDAWGDLYLQRQSAIRSSERTQTARHSKSTVASFVCFELRWCLQQVDFQSVR